jgi:outer membrane protein OmpA-like peptidoglycan-associated protein
MDFSIIQKLAGEPFYANQKNEYQVQFVPTTASAIQAETAEILTKTIVIQFYPNSDDIEKKVDKAVQGKTVQELYDPNAPFVVEEAGKLSGQFGAARIVIEGHTDASMRNSGQVTPADVQDLSLRRANAVKQALLRKFPTLEPNQFTTVGRGWDAPADANDPGNHAKNRRVEILTRCFRALPPGGRMVIQEMCEGPEPGHLPAAVFVADEFFPGDRIGTYLSVQHAARRAGFEVAHLECFGPHYYRTSLEWARRLAARFDEAEALVGYRTAMMHLLCQAGFAWYFAVGAIDLVQYVLVKPERPSPRAPASSPSP